MTGNLTSGIALGGPDASYHRENRVFAAEQRVQGPATAVQGVGLTADSRQVGGDHYKRMQVSPWDALEAWLTPEEFRGFLKGTIIKYLARANSGKAPHDVEIGKAEHYQQKLHEVLQRASGVGSK